MHFQDLGSFRYHDGPFDAKNWCVPLLAVGWLEAPHPFTRGAAPQGLVSRIRILSSQAAKEFILHNFFGLHHCSICAMQLLEKPLVERQRRARLITRDALMTDIEQHLDSLILPGSNSNLFVPGNGVVFVAPGRVDHYMEAHSYLPPQQFIDAVFECPDLSSPEYRQALFAANANVKTPL